MTNSRSVVEGQLVQGVDEAIAYTLTTTPWGSSPGSVVVKAYDMTTGGTDVTTTKLTGSASASGDVITLPRLAGLVEGHLYRIEVKFVCSGNTFEAYIQVRAER